VDKNEPMMTTHGVGQAICANIKPPPMLSPNLKQKICQSHNSETS